VQIRIRVLIDEMPAMLRDIIVDVLTAQPDIELIRAAPRARVRFQETENEPEVVIAAAGEEDQAASAIARLQRWPRARLLTVQTNGRESVLYELQTRATSLGELSPKQLVDAIRGASRPAITSGSTDQKTPVPDVS
jgi:DNA-binding NarL/FixJ family response regulator